MGVKQIEQKEQIDKFLLLLKPTWLMASKLNFSHKQGFQDQFKTYFSNPQKHTNTYKWMQLV